MPERPELAEVIRRAIEALLDGVHTAMIGRVVRYDAATQKVDVQPLVKHVFLDEEGKRQVQPYPVISEIPVAVMSGGGYRITFPIRAGKSDGDLAVLVFAEGSLDRWLAGKGEEVDPEIDHRHALIDAMAIVGVRPFGAPLQDVPTDTATFGKDGGQQIKIGDNGIELDATGKNLTLKAQTITLDAADVVITVDNKVDIS